jgi:hypothetical protein
MPEEEVREGGEQPPEIQWQYQIEYINPVQAIESSISVLGMLEDRFEDAPYPDYPDDKLKMIIRAMAIIERCQKLLQEQLKTEE